MFLLAAVFFFILGGILAMMIRGQLATPRTAFMDAELCNQIFTMHGTVMMFLFAVPLIEGTFVRLLPKMLGTRDLAFPMLAGLCYRLPQPSGGKRFFKPGETGFRLVFAGFLIKVCWLTPVSAVLVAALARRRAWSLGARQDRGAQPSMRQSARS